MLAGLMLGGLHCLLLSKMTEMVVVWLGWLDWLAER